MSENNNHHSKRNSRRDPNKRTPKCRRNLFGKMEDSEEFAREVRQLQMEDAKRFSEAWNYDPETDTALPGKYEWTVAGSVASSSGLLTLPSSLSTEEDSSPSEDMNMSSFTEPSFSQHSSANDEIMDEDVVVEAVPTNENSPQEPPPALLPPSSYYSECNVRRKMFDKDNDSGGHTNSSNGTKTPSTKPPRM